MSDILKNKENIDSFEDEKLRYVLKNGKFIIHNIFDSSTSIEDIIFPLFEEKSQTGN